MNPAPIKPLIFISDLDKIDFRVGTILAAEDVAHCEKLVCGSARWNDPAQINDVRGLPCRSAPGPTPIHTNTIS
jgi:hypothetical protein